jgi:hypothetical protein
MIIIAGYSLTDAAVRDAAVAAFQPMVERARRESGCLDLHVGADPLDAERINVFEKPAPAAKLIVSKFYHEGVWPGLSDDTGQRRLTRFSDAYRIQAVRSMCIS